MGGGGGGGVGDLPAAVCDVLHSVAHYFENTCITSASPKFLALM